MALLHLRGDGTFAAYDREHLFIAISDEGRWRQVPAGAVELCSHYQFEPIRTGGLSLYAGAEDLARLLTLASAIEKRLAAIRGAGDLAPRQLMPVVVRSWQSKDAFGPVPAGGLAPDIMSDDERVSREDLRALVAAVREYVSGRKGNLSTFVPRRYGDLVWLSQDDRPLEKEVVHQYREHKEGAFLPGMVTVAVDGDTFTSLLGTRQSFIHHTEMNVRIPRRALLDDFRKARIADPQCGEFAAGAVALPLLPTAAAVQVPAGEDLGFVTENGSGTTVLVLRADGRFTSHTRLEDETKQMDAGEWSRGEHGLVRLCSNSSVFRPIERDRLGLAIDRATYSRLPRLLSALRAQLAAKANRSSFDPEAIERVAAGVLDTQRAGSEDCSCRRLVHGDEPVPRKQLSDFVAELDQYLRSGAANLREQRLFSLGSMTWLGDPAGRSSRGVTRTLRAFGDGPSVLPEVLVRVPIPTLLALRGPIATSEAAPVAEAAPLCAGFSSGGSR